MPENRGPTAKITLPSGTLLEGAALTFDGRSSSDPDGDSLTYRWNLGDETTRTGGVATRVYGDDGDYDVTLIVSDPQGASDTATARVSVANAAPSVDAIEIPAVQFVIAKPITIGVRAHDPGGNDSVQVLVDWKDGTTSTVDNVSANAVRVAHTYATAGSYPLEVTVRDNDGGVAKRAVDTALVVLAFLPNRPPVAHIRGYTSAYEGAGVFFAADSSTDPDGDSLKVTWLSGDGRRSQGCIDATVPGYGGFDSNCIVFWSYPDDGVYHPSVIVTDGSGAADTASMAITIVNWTPSLQWHRVPAYQTVGSSVSIAVIIMDLGVKDRHTLAVAWGDGTSETVAAADSFPTPPPPPPSAFCYCSAPEILTHSYATVGAYSVTVTVRDDDGADSSATTPTPVLVFDPNARQTIAGYEAKDLGTLGASSARPADLNDRGQVVGTSMTPSGAPHAFLWDEGGMRDLGALGQEGSEAVRINNDGVIAGTVWKRFYGNEDDGLFARNAGTIWKNGVGSTLAGKSFITRFSQPGYFGRVFDQPPRIVRAINSSGQIAWASYGEWNANGWLWKGSWLDLRALPMAMNDRGQVVGGLGLGDGEFFHASLWDRDSSRVLTPLAPRPCAYYIDCSVSVAMDINEVGQIVGISKDSAGQYHFVSWRDDKIEDLGSATWAYGQGAPRIFINDRGEIVASVGGTAFFWSGGHKVTLPSAGGVVGVVGLNENGEVAGTIRTGTGQRVFVWSQNHGLTDLGTGPQGFGGAWAVDINERGDVVGYSAPCVLSALDRCIDRPIALADPGWGAPGAQVRAVLWRKN